jgi:glyoxylase-like metal-dependent hydrolase (beta-lactamase superfamily II)
MIPNYKGNVIEVKNGYVFDLGGLTLEVVELLGHTEGSIGFLDNKKRFFTGDAIGMKILYAHFTKYPLEAFIGVLRHVEQIQARWTEMWCGHFANMNKPLKLDYIIKTRELLDSLVRADGKYTGQPDDELAKRWDLGFVPWRATDGEIEVIYNPARLHYV